MITSDPAIDLVLERLPVEEGSIRFAYNDSTGKQVSCKPGGNLSIGVGINLEIGLDDEEIRWLLAHRVALVNDQLSAFGWYRNLDPVRASVFLDIGFNQGVHGLLGYAHCIAAVTGGDYVTAAKELMNSKAANMNGGLHKRYEHLAELLEHGE